MKKTILLVIISFSFCKCQNKHEIAGLNSEKINNINEIVEAIIIQDSLDIFKNSPESKMFCIELKKITIDIPVKQKDGFILPPVPGNVYISNLLNDKINEEVFFSTKDSSNILAQNSNPEKLKVDKVITDKLNSTTLEKEMIKRKNGQNYRFYQMTIPIFSLDRQKAYVELDYHCGSLCGSGKSLYLKKIKGKWTIIEKWGTWIS